MVQIDDQEEYEGPKEYICPKHGNVGSHVLSSFIKGIKTTYCLYCYIEKIMEGCCKVTEVQDIDG